MADVAEALASSPSLTNWDSSCTGQQDESEWTNMLACLRAAKTAELWEPTRRQCWLRALVCNEATSATLPVRVESCSVAARVKEALRQPPVVFTLEQLRAPDMAAASQEAFAEIWDNDEDAVYDHWRELYGV